VNTSRLVFAPGVQSDIVDHAREGTARTPPVEVCGVLAGARGATGPAEPSPVDRELATWPGYVYLVVSLAGAEPVLSAWRWTGERFKRLSVEREASSGSKHETSPDEP
jgi:proteasome lid subunit RPN8/RPN11